jgi:hypothetical protein
VGLETTPKRCPSPRRWDSLTHRVGLPVLVATMRRRITNITSKMNTQNYRGLQIRKI